MKRVVAFFLIISALTFNSCAFNNDHEAAIPQPTLLVTQEPISSAQPLSPPSDPDIISPLAEIDLLPVEEYSWIREYPVEYVMIHFSSNVVINIKNPYSLNGVRNIFENNYVSTNYIIDRDGTIHCWIPEQRVAWHAGKGSLNGNEKYENKMNLYSIGIELLAIGSKNDMKQYLSSKQYDSIPSGLAGYTEAQYKSLIALLKDITVRWNIQPDKAHILGHEEYNTSKSDPGELFDWNRVISNID